MTAQDAAANGYLHPDYTASLAGFGRPRHLPLSDGWILEREAGEGAADAMGPYPIFACRDWSALHRDLDALAETGLVSLGLVADPFGDWSEDDLQRCFPDRLIRFKDHFVADLGEVRPETLSKHHRYYARKAMRDVEVDVFPGDPADFLDDWAALYGTLTERHGLTGIKAFSRDAFAAQLRIPGMVVLRAREGETVVGAHLWYVQGDVAYSHLAALSDRGYALNGSYALYWFAIEHFRERVRWLEIGAGAGTSTDADDGLTRFKRGWASGTRPVWFCGRIFDAERYAALTAARGLADAAYFPAYRAGEFG
ncbi:MAG TPA: GNAT family N-acetyltransferase [Allosphingosinicella sp.]|jgi:hypothetical protein